jgi:NADP-dependent 3-hydroxy acid dehydrogenase YdfG
VRVLVNNAISGTLGRIAELSLEEWQRVVAINLTATFLATKAALGPMLAQGGGAIVNVSSAAALQAEEGLAPYAAAKAGVLALTRNTAAEYGGRGIPRPRRRVVRERRRLRRRRRRDRDQAGRPDPYPGPAVGPLPIASARRW